MGLISRVLPAQPVLSLSAYQAAGGGRGIVAARKLGPAGVIDEVLASGLRGRGGAGFPTGTKWRTVSEHAAASAPPTVVVNGAEGEPGTFKDRAIIRANPFAIIEGAVIAASAVGATEIIVAIKESFEVERDRLESAVAALSATDWLDDLSVTIAVGPSEYLFGEETGLLEVLNGRPPFPRIAPPFRHGVDEVGGRPEEPGGAVMAEPGLRGAAPTLVNNVETVANVSMILAEGADWFRSVGTADSPGTAVCTVSGSTLRAGVGEFAMDTPLAEVIDTLGGGPRPERQLVGAMSGVANAIVPAAAFDTPITYEAMQAAGSGLGAAGFIVVDDATDIVGLATGISRFLAVESCGQCTPCKQDGLAIWGLLDRMCRNEVDEISLQTIDDLTSTVADGARCFLANEHQIAIDSLKATFPGAWRAHLDPAHPVTEPETIVPIAEIGDDGSIEFALDQLGKQPDWSYDATESGMTPVERLANVDEKGVAEPPTS